MRVFACLLVLYMVVRICAMIISDDDGKNRSSETKDIAKIKLAQFWGGVTVHNLHIHSL